MPLSFVGESHRKPADWAGALSLLEEPLPLRPGHTAPTLAPLPSLHAQPFLQFNFSNMYKLRRDRVAVRHRRKGRLGKPLRDVLCF